MDMKRPKLSQTSAAEIIAGNEDLLTEAILLRLPSKVLVKFQLVCKHWQSLIFSSSFSRAHTRRLIHSGGAFIFSPSESDVLYFSPIGNAFDHKVRFNDSTKIRQSCNGLWLLELDGGKYYSVYNPTTKQQSRVFKLRRRDGDGNSRRHHRAVCLGFDPSRSIYYKVFFIHIVDYEATRVETYDSETGEWTSIYPSSTGVGPTLYNAVYWNNKLYSFKTDPELGSLTFLDLQTGNFGCTPRIETPLTNKRGVIMKHSWQFRRNHHFTESNGHLRCVVTIDDYLGITRHLFLFELMEDNSGWLQLYRADLKQIVSVFPKKMNRDFRVVGVVRGADQTEEHVLLHVEGSMVISYRFCDGNFELALDLKPLRETYKQQHGHELEVSDRSIENELFVAYKLFPFIETLAPV